MKKTAKSVMLVMLMAVLVFTLTGCGSKKEDKEENKGDTLVATRAQNDDYFGEYKEIIEITFKDDKAETIVMTMDFASEETAQGIAAIFSLAGSEGTEGMQTKQEGTKFIMTMNAAAYADQEGIEEGQLSKEYLKKSLEDEGYEVK